VNESADGLRIAVIDDDRAFVTVLAKRFERAGWTHRRFSEPPSVERLSAMRLNAVLFDAELVPLHASEFIGRLSRAMPGLGIVVTMHGGAVHDRIMGLRAGADDWIAKPCHPEEVMARLEVAVRARRVGGRITEDDPIAAGELEVRPDLYQAFVGAESLQLTRREFEVVSLLAKAQGRALEREEIYRRVWGYEMVHGDRSVDVFVRKLRAKLERASPGWDYIHTHHGVGYRFDARRSQAVYEIDTAP
jgi:DNA-binding response OmpR family regulator